MADKQKWPHGARAAICLTFDNMGEAADINRNLWPSDQPIGKHYSVTRVLPQFLSLVRKYEIPITYFTEAWNLGVYPDAIKSIAEEGHEVAWHAWQHENWAAECEDAEDERRNFERSFGLAEGIEGFVGESGAGKGSKVVRYKGFRPPGGLIHGERTLKMCREFELGYVSPAAEEAALVPLGGGDSIAILPFRWRGVDAYYYMEVFGKLRKSKGVFGEEVQTSQTLVDCYIKEIDKAIEDGGFLALLFHPFLNDEEEKLQALEEVLKHLSKRMEEGSVWMARCKDVEKWVREHPEAVGEDPQWDQSSWR